MLSSGLSPPSTFPHPSTPFTSPNVPFLLTSNRIHLRQSLAFPTPIKEKHHFYGPTSSRKLQLHDFLETVPSSQRLEAVKNFHRDGGLQTITDFNHLLASLITAGEFEIALNLKSNLSSFGLVPDNWTCSILVSFYCKINEPMQAKSVVDHMMENRFEPNVATFTTLINSFCKIGRLQDALQVFDVMPGIGCEPTINTYNCLLKGLCYVGKVEEAYDFLINIKNSSIKPDIYTYTAMMNGFCKVGRSNEALELLDEALEMELIPSVVTYNTLFNGYFKEGRPLSGVGLLKRMKERNCKPDFISYSTLLHGLIKWGKLRAALEICREMVEIGFRADERMMNTLLRSLCGHSLKEKELLKDVYDVFEEMRNGQYTIYPCAYDLVIQALNNGEEMDKCFMILNEMVKIGYSPRTFTLTVVTRSLCGIGDVDKALAVLMLMHKDRKPCVIPYNILINELNRQGRSLDACNVYVAALKRGVLPKRKPRKS